MSHTEFVGLESQISCGKISFNLIKTNPQNRTLAHLSARNREDADSVRERAQVVGAGC